MNLPRWILDKPERKKTVIIDSEKKLDKLANKMMKIKEFAYDTETTDEKIRENHDASLLANGPRKSFHCVCTTISWGAFNNYYIPLFHRRYEDVKRNIPLEMFQEYMQPVFGRKDIRLIGHNLKFDMHVLKRCGIDIFTEDIFCTMIASFLCDENLGNGLKDCTVRNFGVDQTHFAEIVNTVPKEIKKEFGLKANNKATFDLVSIKDGGYYASDDPFFTYYNYLWFLQELENTGMEDVFYKKMMPFLFTLFDMEERGITLDRVRLDEMSKELQIGLDDYMYQLIDILGMEFNPNSSAQLGAILFGYKGKEPKTKSKSSINMDSLIEKSYHFPVTGTTKNGAPSTDSTTIWLIGRSDYKSAKKLEGQKFCSILSKYKKLEKLKTAFIDGTLKNLYDDGKIHTMFKEVGAVSGRLSSSKPNLQQLPNAEDDDPYKIRSLYKISKPGNKLISCDFSNLEVRVMAHFSGDEALLNMFKNHKDVHGTTAVNVFNLDCDPNEVKKKYHGLRGVAKTVNFLMNYLGGAKTLYENLRTNQDNPVDLGSSEYLKLYPDCNNGIEVAQKLIDKYFALYKGIRKFIVYQKRYAHQYGYVKTILGRKRRLPDINSNDYKKASYCERLSVNGCIQGSASDITSSAQLRIDNDPWFKEHNAYMLVQIHDEILMECPEKYVEECMKRMQHYMAFPFGDDVHLKVDLESEAGIGDNYFEAK